MGSKNAVGRYQILSETLFGTEDNGYYGLQDILSLSDDTLFDAETQERLARALLERRGCSDWMDGNISDNQFQLNLAQEWASVANPNTGRSYYGQNVGTTDAEIKEAMKQTKAKQATQGTQQIAQEAKETPQNAALPSSDVYESTIPIPTGSTTVALKEQGKYEACMQNALQAAEKRIEQDPQDREAWYTKGLALYYLNRGAEADVALAKAGDLGIQFKFDGESFSRVSPDLSPSVQQSSSEAKGEMIEEEGSVAPTSPTTSMPSDDTLSSASRGLEPITKTIISSQSQSEPKDFQKGDDVKTTDLLNVRSVPGLPIDGTEDTRISEPVGKGSTGTILEGPVEADGFSWWKIQYNDGTIGWSQDKRLELDTQDASFGRTFGATSSSGELPQQRFGSSLESDLGGVNFTSIKLNYISMTTDDTGGVNFDLILKAEKSDGTKPGIDIQKATRLDATAFLTSLAIPDSKLWVNLNPWEADRIIDDELEESEVGRIMLEADLQMKKDFSNYGNPCANETGKAFWSLLDKKRETLVQQCISKFPGEIQTIDNVRFRPVTAHWIIPDKVYAYSNGTQIYIINSTLTISSEPVADHSTFDLVNQDIRTLSKGCFDELNRSAKEYGKYSKDQQDRMILPYVEADLNSGKKYEDLRDIYVALALAQWYKSKTTPHTDIFRDSLDSLKAMVLKSQNTWSPKEIWDNYVDSFKNYEYKCWDDTTIQKAGETVTISRGRSAGGVEFDGIRDHLITMDAMPPGVRDKVEKAVSNGFIKDGEDILFGYRFHVDQKKGTAIDVSSSAKSPNRQIDNAESSAKMRVNETKTLANITTKTNQVTCPEGWMGPDENGECWQMQITG